MTKKGHPGSNEQQALFKLLIMPRICASLQSSRSLMFCIPPDTCPKNVYNLLIILFMTFSHASGGDCQGPKRGDLCRTNDSS